MGGLGNRGETRHPSALELVNYAPKTFAKVNESMRLIAKCKLIAAQPFSAGDELCGADL